MSEPVSVVDNMEDTLVVGSCGVVGPFSDDVRGSFVDTVILDVGSVLSVTPDGVTVDGKLTT